jgi:hypothetical protein
MTAIMATYMPNADAVMVSIGGTRESFSLPEARCFLAALQFAIVAGPFSQRADGVREVQVAMHFAGLGPQDYLWPLDDVVDLAGALQGALDMPDHAERLLQSAEGSAV